MPRAARVRVAMASSPTVIAARVSHSHPGRMGLGGDGEEPAREPPQQEHRDRDGGDDDAAGRVPLRRAPHGWTATIVIPRSAAAIMTAANLSSSHRTG